ncbi:MAG TPA: isochorismatase family protein [Parachlamydiaceae bacterium]|nr:isochorismatase family protein [Parachlamydiaceae bacterium]
MNKNYKLSRDTTGLLLIDVQEKLFPYVENSCPVMQTLQKAVRGFQILSLPIYVTEQYPQGLGSTVATLKGVLGPAQAYLVKTTFSCLDDTAIKDELLKAPVDQWVVVGIEAHVCVLQTVKDLIEAGKQVTVLNDAISSRSIYDFSTAIAELRDCGARISSTETVLFELLRNSKAAEFKEISQLIK